MKLLRGKKIASELLAGIKLKIKKQKLKPRLAVVLVGENRASKLYVELKSRAAERIGIALALYKFKSEAKEKDIIKLIKVLNKNKSVSGIIVQLPLPKKCNARRIINAISFQKDADGFCPKNIKKFLAGKKGIEPVFPAAIIKMINSVETRLIASLQNRRAIIISNSDIFGKIMVRAMEKRKIKAVYLLSKNLKKNIDKIQSSDILITAVGKPKIIKGEMIKKGAIIIDGGITKRNKKVLGDIDFSSVAGIAGYLSPVPGGVGPVTVACLLENVRKLALAQNGKK